MSRDIPKVHNRVVVELHLDALSSHFQASAPLTNPFSSLVIISLG